VDILRRAGIETRTVSIMGRKEIRGSHGIQVEADELFEEIDRDAAALCVLPGGMPGTRHLGAHAALGTLLQEAAAAGRRVAAICAAPSVLGGLGILKGHRAACYPGFEDKLTEAEVSYDPVVVSSNITTSRGMGTAIPFALSLVASIRGQEAADELAKAIIYIQ
jgi:4-methyl-5(b-hydroxyethyl)-thiazole monophosphate biosynthesis